ncbi:MAG: helix-turn-helix domain-containing protein [Bacillota bacterium]|jgi:transcriptional regulator with XRE-family HTH domain
MTPNKKYILDLVAERNWTWAELARRTELSRSEISRWVHGKRRGGRKLIGGILKAFSEEPIERIFFLPFRTPKGAKSVQTGTIEDKLY